MVKAPSGGVVCGFPKTQVARAHKAKAAAAAVYTDENSGKRRSKKEAGQALRLRSVLAV